MTAAGGRARAAGFSLVEVSIVAVVLVVLSAAIGQSLRGLWESQNSAQLRSKTTSLGERLLARIGVDIACAAKVYAEGAAAREWLDLLDLGGGPGGESIVLAGSRMPVTTTVGTFTADPVDAVQTGNLLLLTRRDDTVRADRSPDSTPRPTRVDTLRFVVWHLQVGAETGVDLSRWMSVRLARLADVESIVDPAERTALVTSLVRAGIAVAYDPAATATEALWRLDVDGSMTPFAAGELLAADRDGTDRGILSVRHVGVATNGSVSARVPFFARPATGFPNGFEVKRDGNGAGDLLFVRLVIATPGGAQRRVEFSEATRQFSFREE